MPSPSSGAQLPGVGLGTPDWEPSLGGLEYLSCRRLVLGKGEGSRETSFPIGLTLRQMNLFPLS